jgi:RecA-family ATPase
LSAEDDLADTIVPRLINHDADLNKITAVEGVHKNEEKLYFNLGRDLPALEEAINATEDVRLVVIDPLTAYCGGIDSHKNAEVRSLLGPLSDLAARKGVAVLGISHLRKGSDTKAIYKVLGSLAFVAAARSVWLVTKDAENDDRRIMSAAKCNLATRTTSLAFSIIDGVVCFEPTVIHLTADQALNPESEEERTELDIATEWLQQFLAEGRQQARTIFKTAEKDRIKEKKVYAAAKKLNVKKTREGFGEFGVWYWQLPGPP